MSVPHYHTQPATLDPNVETPEDAPLAQGHDADDAADVAQAHDAHRQAVAEEADQGEVGARAPGDHAGSETPEGDCPPSGTIEDVKAWVGDDSDRAGSALTAEREGQNRSSLITWLEEHG
jgi:hypothetical protein